MALYYNFAFAAKEEQPIWMVKLLVEGMKQQLRFLYPGGRGYPREQAESKGLHRLYGTRGASMAKGQRSDPLASGIHLRLPPALIERVDQAVADEAMTRPEWLRMLIRRELARLKKAAQRAPERGTQV